MSDVDRRAPIGLLLAGGRGSRFDPSGRRDKLLASIDGEAVCVRTARRLASTCQRSFAVLPPDTPERLRLLEQAGCEPLVTDTTRLGMGHSIAHGARLILERCGARSLVLALGDMPNVRTATLRTLIARLGDDPHAIVAPVHKGRRGHPVVFGAGHLPALARLTGDRGASAILEQHRPRLIEVDDPGVLQDIDTPGDFATETAHGSVNPSIGTALPPAHRYRICPIDPHAHLFEVELTIAEPDRSGQRLALPAWIPGSYMIREFARHIVTIEARMGSRAVALTKLDKHTWQARRGSASLTVRYRVYAWDLSVRGAHLDATHGFFNGTSVFLSVVGQEDRRCEVEIQPPPESVATGWQVATTLPRAGATGYGFGSYAAADYDELIDHPVEMGCFTLASFEAAGARHDVAITGRHDADTERLTADLSRVCALQAKLFEPGSGRAPFDRYLFQLMVVGDGYGGLEHRASTALIARRADLPWAAMSGVPEGYRRLLGLCSHEYFHAWHVKRIKPAGFVHHDLRAEDYTRLLWLFEGFTSYYDDLTLRRAGVITIADYLDALAGTITSVMRSPGRRLQSVASSSFDAWIKHYRQDENSPNAIVSYYAKGALVALALDLTIRAETGSRKSLDDLMCLLWERFGRSFYGADGRVSAGARGVGEDEIPSLLAEATGLDLSMQIRQWVDGTADLPLVRLLERAGVSLTLRRADHAGAALGLRASESGARLKVTTVYSDGPAQRAGLCAGDELVAIGGLRADMATLKTALTRARRGTPIEVHAFRRDELMSFEPVIEAAPTTEAKLALTPSTRAPTARLRNGWIGVA